MAADKPIVVGSKIFTEGYILGEVAAQVIEASAPPVPVTRKLGMGSTGILFEALKTGAIDVYPDYTGTLACAHCSQSLAPRAGNYRLGAARLELPMTALGANFLDPSRQIGHELIFRNYLCPSCGTALDETTVASGSERKLVTVLFADVTGSTQLGEQLDPEQLRAVMETYFSAMRIDLSDSTVSPICPHTFSAWSCLSIDAPSTWR